MDIALWILQILLAIVFLLAGIMKLLAPKTTLLDKLGDWVNNYPLSTIKLIGLIEIIGAVGLVLPGYLEIAPVLIPIAAAGFALVMFLAARLHAKRNEKKETNINLVLLVLSLVVFLGRLNVQ